MAVLFGRDEANWTQEVGAIPDQELRKPSGGDHFRHGGDTPSSLGADGPTIAECIASLKKIPDVPRKLYLSALNTFRVRENREIWMAEEDDAIRLEWLSMNMDGSSTSTA